MKLLTLLLVLFLAGCGESGDFDAGLEAYENEDYATALKYFKPLAEQGHIEAQGYLGLMYYNGSGVKRDKRKSIKWLTLAGEKGDLEAQTTLANHYSVRGDYTKEAKWLTLSATQGHARAQHRIASLFYHGKGVSQDYKEAAKWYALAAAQNHPPSQISLSYMYNNGKKSVPQSLVKSYMWAHLAISSGYKNKLITEFRRGLSNRMTRRQLERARELAADCHSNDYKGC